MAFDFWAGEHIFFFFLKKKKWPWLLVHLMAFENFAIVSLSSYASRLFVVNYNSSFITQKSSVTSLMRWLSVSLFPYQSILLKCFILLKKSRQYIEIASY